MQNDYLTAIARKLKFWGILAPLILIALCLVIGAREGFEAGWEGRTIPVILGVALIIFSVMQTVGYALEWIASPKIQDDDS